MGKGLKVLLAAVAVALTVTAVTLAATTRTGATSDTLVFGTASEPTSLDGAVVSDGESLRVIDQITEGLVGLKNGTTVIVPKLATSWRASNGGKVWSFKLRKGVRFQDGTPFNAKAVCANFNRWYNFTGAFASDSTSYYYYTVFGGYKKPAKGLTNTPLYRSCKAVGDSTAVITLRRPNSAFLGALSLTAFGMQSPAAMAKYGANKGTLSKDGVFTPGGQYGVPGGFAVGTGPFKLESWKIGDKLVIVRNDSYWGKKAILRRVIFRAIPDNAARLQALQTGEIQGYDLVEPQDIPTVQKDSKLKVLDRPAFNVAYVTINQAVKPFDNPLVRQAVAYGLDRAGVVKSFYAGRGTVADEFMPPEVVGYSKTVPKYTYNPEKAKQLLQKAGLTLPVEVEFWYPTDVSRPYMPDPARNFQAFAASLDKSGFKVIPKSAPWRPDYVSRVQSGTAGALNLIGWTGDFGDPDNFIGTFFRTKQGQWGFNNPQLFALLNKALIETNLTKRAALYRQANNMIMKFLPGVPYVHTKPALAFQKNVVGYIPSPVSLEPFSTVRFVG
ncbi:MAG: ABC transporter substrate-binding protein [Gaiella sp.]|jgi:peptide/nickel transport system substrate-binding protein|uniref:ABC transporter substrate-binding protein n=1 Tax=Gaiella sp. TaxID=2663207 RepID=UPI002BA8C077|nr:ABC transporter substrate-binding protein [Gaiella sp.]